MTSSIFLSIGWRFLLQYFKSKNTTYVTHFSSISIDHAMERGGWSTDNVLKSVYQQTFSSERRKIDKMIDGYFNGIVMHGDDINSSSSSE